MTMPTITVHGTSYRLADTGSAWVIHHAAGLLDRLAALIVDTYRIQSEVAAEHDSMVGIGLTRVTTAVLSRHLTALSEGGIALTYDSLTAPHTGEWRGTSPAHVELELTRLFDVVRDDVVEMTARVDPATTTTIDAATAEDLLVRSNDGGVARTMLLRQVARLVPARYGQSEFARRAGVTRMTVRNWLGL